ncbi:MAG: VWA domain-containing protein [Hyphomicrobiaceae bacterium]|nr:VWA domain-containing protein [Hyphomicrobiaceae bacterium]
MYRKKDLILSGIAAISRRWWHDKNGSIAIMFGLTFSIMLMFVAGAVDISRWMAARTESKAAVDSAVLAGARSLQVENENIGGAIAAAQRYYKENTKNLQVVDDSITFQTSRNNMAMEASGQSFVTTPFLSLIGIPKMALFTETEAIAEAVVATGGKGEGGVEIAMMLDITGSMRGDKLSDLKDAAKDLLDIVLLQENGKTRVSLVPFSEAINIEKNWAAEVVSNGPQWVKIGGTKYFLDPQCATERTGDDALTDAAPNGQNKLGKFYSKDGECMPKSASVIPLSYDKSALKSAIEQYEASGNTAGHLGTAWAWYMLSPNWAQRVPPASRAGEYDEPGLRKIAILMTDGEYNTQYADGFPVSANSAPNGSSTEQARTLCTNMKAKGITVYTVGFKLDRGGDSEQTMQMCASDASMAFSADNGDALKQAFRDIALQISTLYLIR